jgi:myo-inositol 2-dehydrogenase / D-chiro-inositol 1-dehydrogenase
MRLGLIGVGRIGSLHARTLIDLADVDSFVVCDAVPALAKTAAERLGAEAVDTPAELLAAGIDGVVIAAATAAHPELLIAAVDAGLPAFCEKPLASSAAEAKRVRDYVTDAGAVVQIGYPRRFDPAFVAARAAVVADELGWVHTVRSTTLDPAPPPHEYIAVSGGIFRDCSVHDFDAIRWVTGQEVVEVYATGTNKGDPFFGELGDVDTASSVLTLSGGCTALVSNSRYNGRGYDVRLELHGSVDSIAVGLEPRLPLRSVEPGTTFPDETPHTFFMDRFRTAFRAELASFAAVVAGQRPSPCTVDDALEATRIAEACALSVHEHRPVAMAEIRL